MEVSANGRFRRGLTEMQSIEENLSLAGIAKKLSSLKLSLSKRSCKAKLWIQYIEMIDILKKFIQTELTGNWNLHLQAIEAMLPYFAASSHFLFAKSARVYLQNMKELETTNSNVFNNFQNGRCNPQIQKNLGGSVGRSGH